MKKTKLLIWFFLAFSQLGLAENIVFPSAAEGKGWVDATKPPYNAPKDGIRDATSAINAALKANIGSGRCIYLPNGTYLISKTLVWPNQPNGNLPAELKLQGQSQAGVTIKLKDNCPDFTNPDAPQAMIATGHDVAQNFFNGVKNLTIHSGSGNAGAIGLRYYANNVGTSSNITIVSGDGNGAIGLDLYWQNENGPLLVKNLTVDGFDVGVNTGSCQNSQTIEHLTLRNQKKVGILTSGGVLNIRNLVSINTVPAVNNSGILTILGASLSGGSSSVAAIFNTGTLYVRDFSAKGYARGIDNQSGNGQSMNALRIAEWSSHNEISLNAGKPGMLKLPVKETPDMIWDAESDWQAVIHPGDGTDATTEIQQAIDAGKTTVYLNPGNYKVTGKIYVRGNVRTLYGFGCFLDVQKDGGFVVREGSHPIVVFENFSGGYGIAFFVTQSSKRIVAIKNVCNWGVKKDENSGDLFLEDICSNPWTWFEFYGGNVWARQLNPENDGTHILNKSTNLWILGLKTERGGTLIETVNSGQTEVCGFFCYTTTDPAGRPMFINNDSKFSAIGAETSYSSAYETFVKEMIGGTTRYLKKDNLPGACGAGHQLPYYVSNVGKE